MRSFRLVGVTLLGLGAAVVVGLSQSARAHDPVCTWNEPIGPGQTGVGQSGADSKGYGLYGVDTAFVSLNYLQAGDNCTRNITGTHFATDEIDWAVNTDADAACKWTVMYTCSAVGNVITSTDVDNAFDCDEAHASATVTVTPGGATVSCNSDSWNAADADGTYQTLTTSVQTKVCQPDLSRALDFQANATSTGQIISEAKAQSLATYSTFQFTRISTTLCGHSH